MNYWDKLMVITDQINDIMKEQGINKECLSWDDIDLEQLNSRQIKFVKAACDLWDYIEYLDQCSE